MAQLSRATKQDSGSGCVYNRGVKPRRTPVLIGWTEYVDLPEWGVRRLRAKVDTGARSSALHVENIRELPRGVVSFDVVMHREKRDRHVRVRARITRRSRVRSSNGELSQRLFVETTLRLAGIEKPIEIGLVDRAKMIHRMLLGRAALSGPFLVDVDHRMLHAKRRRRASRPD